KEIESKIKRLREKVSGLREDSKHPTPEAVVTFRNAILPMRATDDRVLDDIIDKESSLMTDIRAKEKAESKIKEYRSSLEDNEEEEVANLQRSRDSTLGKIASSKTMLDSAKSDTEELRKMRDNWPKSDTSGEDDEKIKAQERSSIIAGKLHQLAQQTLEIWTERARANVEEVASGLFLSLSNNSEYYERLKIMEDFGVEIRNTKKGKDAGSQAQWMVIAYCLIDALGRTSG
ncbi:uncharacterized protein METZ01_LOCUS508363, partial [marine metagenome]